MLVILAQIFCQLPKALQPTGKKVLKTNPNEVDSALQLAGNYTVLCPVKYYSGAILSYDSEAQEMYAQGSFWDQTICIQPTEQSKTCNLFEKLQT